MKTLNLIVLKEYFSNYDLKFSLKDFMFVNTIFIKYLPDYIFILCTKPYQLKTWITGLAVQSIDKWNGVFLNKNKNKITRPCLGLTGLITISIQKIPIPFRSRS
jgi:hypothetical protein